MKIVLFANTEWYLYNFRRSLALALRDAGHEVIMVSPPGPYGERLTEVGLRWLPAPMDRRSLNPVRECALILWLARLFKRERIDLVHGFTIKSAVYGSIAARFAGVPARVSAVDGLGYVFTSNAVRARMLRSPVRAIMRRAFGGSNARLILQNRDDLKLFLEARLIHPEQVRLITGAGVDCRRFDAATTRTSTEPLRVLLAARLLWDKGIAEYVEASRLLQTRGRQIRFLLAGSPDSGNPAAVPETWLRDRVHEGLIEWLGHVDNMPALLASIHAMILPSYREGLPTSLVEGAACGLPLVTADSPGCREVVEHDVDGLLVPVRDPAALAAAIARIDDDPVLGARLGAAARVKALERFDERIVIARMMDVYRELLPGFA